MLWPYGHRDWPSKRPRSRWRCRAKGGLGAAGPGPLRSRTGRSISLLAEMIAPGIYLSALVCPYIPTNHNLECVKRSFSQPLMFSPRSWLAWKRSLRSTRMTDARQEPDDFIKLVLLTSWQSSDILFFDRVRGCRPKTHFEQHSRSWMKWSRST